MAIKDQIKEQIEKVIKELSIDIVPSIDYPSDATHGDYATNVALVAAKKAGKNPMELAEKIVEELGSKNKEVRMFNEIQVAKPGFINFWVSSDLLISSLSYSSKHETELSGKKIMVEFAHPNTHKAFHIGHLRNITTGESIVRLLESTGVKVIRANYQGDVGMHIAKCLYGLLHDDTFDIIWAETKDVHERVKILGNAYAVGSSAYEENENAKKEIGEINKKIYAKNPSIFQLYQTTRQWSLDYFDEIYKRVYTHFDRLYFESETYESGLKNVLEGLKKGIFQKSDGAIIFPGSKYGLHDRVFITSEGNPTYEGKDMGLAPIQHKEYHPDKIIHVLGPEQYGYTRVIFKALDLLFPEDAEKQLHLVYGWVKLKHGKMSSRTGNVILGEWLLDEAKKKILESYDISDEIAEQVAVSAVKYSFLKVGLNQEIAFDLDESISLQGNSGPYLQYTFSRTQSVLAKVQSDKQQAKNLAENLVLKVEERNVLRLLSRFPEIVEEAAVRYSPNILCTYLFELAQAFNLFYQKFPILKSEEAERDFRLELTGRTGETLKKGLNLLGIQAPQSM
jgi:arginyl-tRNA synthetase